MTRPAIAADLRRFILSAIPSVPYLEALLLMRGAGSAGLDLSSLAAALYVSEATAAALLQHLQQDGLVEQAGSGENAPFRYAPSGEQAAFIERLAQEYAHNLVGVSMLIHATTAARAGYPAGGAGGSGSGSGSRPAIPTK